MNLAYMTDYTDIWNVFKQHKDIFPYMRSDYLTKKIENKNVIWQNGTAIVFGIYQKRQNIKNMVASRGDAYISEIVSDKKDGSANQVLQEFFTFVHSNVWLQVRSNNIRACKFYEKNGMQNVGSTAWKNGSILGYIYKKEIK